MAVNNPHLERVTGKEAAVSDPHLERVTGREEVRLRRVAREIMEVERRAAIHAAGRATARVDVLDQVRPSKISSLERRGGQTTRTWSIVAWFLDIRFYLCFPLVLLIGGPVFEFTKFLFSAGEPGVQDYQRFGLTYLLRPYAEDWVRTGMEDALFFSVYIVIKLGVALAVLYVLGRSLPKSATTRLPGNEWFAIGITFALWLSAVVSQFVFYDAPCGDAFEDALLRSHQITFLGLLVAASPSLFLGPIFEEVEIRGVVFKMLYAQGWVARIVLSAIVFVYPHLVNRTGSFFPIDAIQDRDLVLGALLIWFPSGLAYGYAREISGSLKLPILLHMLWNIGFTVFGLVAVGLRICPA